MTEFAYNFSLIQQFSKQNLLPSALSNCIIKSAYNYSYYKKKLDITESAYKFSFFWLPP